MLLKLNNAVITWDELERNTMRQPQKRNQTSFATAPGAEPKGRMMGFRPPISLEEEIERAWQEGGYESRADWLLEAAIAHLEKSSRAATVTSSETPDRKTSKKKQAAVKISQTTQLN